MATLKELKELATKEKLKGRSSMNRDQLCQELNNLDKYELDCSPNRRKSSPKKKQPTKGKGSPSAKGKERNLEKLTVKQLKDELKEKKIPFKSTLRKAELVNLLQQNMDISPPKKSPPKKSPPKKSPPKKEKKSPPKKKSPKKKKVKKEEKKIKDEVEENKEEKKIKDEVEEIRQHYNKVNNDRRKEENILALRKFNNYIKTFLINDAFYGFVNPRLDYEDFKKNGVFDEKTFFNALDEAGREGAEKRKTYAVLDMCCGRGGDMMKWFGIDRCEVVFCDISNKSLEEAKRRYDAIKGPKYKAKFLQVDCFSSDVTKALKKIGAPKFDVISCQFAVHYAFSDEQRVNNLFTTIDENLNEGGVFLGTTTNSRWLLERGRKEKKFGNKVFQVEFEHQVTKKEEAKDYGIGYSFSLANAVEDLKEYVVKPQVLKKKGEEVGLELVQIKNFKKYDEDLMERGYYPDKHNMRLGTLTPQEKPLLDAYITFIFHRE